MKKYLSLLFFWATACLPMEGALEDKIPPSNFRYSTFHYALQLLERRHAQTLVETGTARGGKYNCAGDGCSTLIFAEWAIEHSAHLYSVDIDAHALERSRQDVSLGSEAVTWVHSDSIAFLKNFGKPIDFLYLDSYDFDPHNPLPSQLHHLHEIQAAYPWLGKNSVVMIDDCALRHGGKGKFVIPYLVKRGWQVAKSSYQVILIRKGSS